MKSRTQKIKERVIKNGRSTGLGAAGGAVGAASLVAGFGITDWRILGGVAAAGLITGAVSKDPKWLQKKMGAIK